MIEKPGGSNSAAIPQDDSHPSIQMKQGRSATLGVYFRSSQAYKPNIRIGELILPCCNLVFGHDGFITGGLDPD